MDFLASQQNAEGYFDSSAAEAGRYRLATTGLSLMAFLSAGHTPDVGRHGPAARAAVDFLLREAPDDGYFGADDSKGMYVHGIVTLALAEAYGVESDPAYRVRLHAVLTKAVNVILAAQALPKPELHAGGWRYTRESVDSDISLSGWNALALRAAQNVGVEVPAEAVEKAVAFVMRCYDKGRQGFAYQPGGAATPGPTGVAVLSLYLLDGGTGEGGAEGSAEGVGDALAAGAKFLAANPAAGGGAAQQHPYYAMYYVTQAAHHAGGEAWPTVSKAVFEKLVASQEPDGGWPVVSTGEPGRVYCSAMAVLTLSVPYGLLPTYQR